MSGEVSAAVIAASAALVVASVTAYFTVTSSHRQRSVDLLISALADMESKTQRRSAAVAALQALRGPLTRRLTHLDRSVWRQYGHAVGQQLFRVLAYVLNHADISTHGTENAIAMTDWLLADPVLDFGRPDQCRRLRASLRSFNAKLPDDPVEDTAAEAFRLNLERWCSELDARSRA